jgi:rhodanese-related sulfurtransferase
MNATMTLPDPAKAREYFTHKMEFTTGPVELKRAMDRDEVVVVDVRAVEDYARGHIPGAISLPQGQWENAAGLHRDKTNVVYCYSQVCHLAATAAMGWAAEGYPVMELEGGFEGWRTNDLPVETSPTPAPVAGKRKAAAAKPTERTPRQENL